MRREGKRDSSDRSGGNFDNCVDMIFGGIIPYYTVILNISTTKFHFNAIIKLPTTTVK